MKFSKSKSVITHYWFQQHRPTDAEKWMVENALDKLLKDGFITTSPVEEYNELFDRRETVIVYELTWEGQFFISDGGYAGRFHRENTEKKRILELEKNQKDSNNRMVRLTLAVAIGTGIAALYYTLEIASLIISWCSEETIIPKCVG